MAPEKYTPAYETTDATLGPILKFCFWLAVTLVIVFTGMYGALRAAQEIPAIGDRPPHPLAALNNPIPPAPHLEMQRGVKQGWDGKTVDLQKPQPFTTLMWEDLRKPAQEELTSYGWIDQDAKIVHVPIERAMELVLQKGFPVRQKPK